MNKYIATRTNVAISTDVHKELVNHLKNDDRKFNRFVERAIKEKIEKEKLQSLTQS